MPKDERDLLEVLKFELEFLEKGGYRSSPREPWRPQFIFEDSPTCKNYDSKEEPGPCSDCVLIQLVPPESRDAKIPCRHIPLDASGETLDFLYRYSDQYEIEEKVGQWLRDTIQRLEEERKTRRRDGEKQPPSSGRGLVGTPLYQSLHPKCANPLCPTAFHWSAGGKFFRFRPNEGGATPGSPASGSPAAVQRVRHYWLCETCSRVFTLVYQEARGVVLELRWLELLGASTRKDTPAA